MVYITYKGKPICQHRNGRCQYATRREAFDRMLRLSSPDDQQDYAIVQGHCPAGVLGNKQEGRV
jgi:hypothetical protein